MLTGKRRGYAVGVQDFEWMRERGSVYADKTEYVWKMVSTDATYYFLSRPRRFGKSLLVDTLRCYFEGRKELFEGLYIYDQEKEWRKHPVIRIDLSSGKYYEKERLHGTISGILRRLESEWNLTPKDEFNYDDRLTELIQAAYRQTGERVVILIDEYDAPMLDSITNRELQDYIRDRIRSLFSPLKAQAQYLRFVFLTGISKFSQLSVFSELNNLNNLTFDPEYEGICGITEEELLTYMKPDIEQLTEATGRWGRIQLTYDQTVNELKRMYDGYHFSERMTDIYNPWSLIYAFEKGKIGNYWFSTGTPSSLINLLKVKNLELPDLEHIETDLDQFDAPTEQISDPIPALFQNGYLTLKSYNPMTDLWTLGFPNQEVYRGFAGSLYKYYVQDYAPSKYTMNGRFWDLKLKKITFEEFIEHVRCWYAGIPYSITDRNQNEQFYQSLLYSLLVGIGADVQAEAQTSDGRMDIALKLPDCIFILELKYGKSAEEAADQILTKDYAVRFAADARPVVAVGLNISQDRRTIDCYKIVTVKQ